MEAYASHLSLTHWSVCVILLYPICSVSPGSELVFLLHDHDGDDENDEDDEDNHDYADYVLCRAPIWTQSCPAPTSPRTRRPCRRSDKESGNVWFLLNQYYSVKLYFCFMHKCLVFLHFQPEESLISLSAIRASDKQKNFHWQTSLQGADF